MIVPILSGYYNSANKTVTLIMAKPLMLSKPHRIVVRGTGSTPITDLNGVALDGQANGTPGTNFTTIFGREILFGVTYNGSPATGTPISKQAGRAMVFRHFQIGG